MAGVAGDDENGLVVWWGQHRIEGVVEEISLRGACLRLDFRDTVELPRGIESSALDFILPMVVSGEHGSAAAFSVYASSIESVTREGASLSVWARNLQLMPQCAIVDAAFRVGNLEPEFTILGAPAALLLGAYEGVPGRNGCRAGSGEGLWVDRSAWVESRGGRRFGFRTQEYRPPVGAEIVLYYAVASDEDEKAT